LAQVWLSEASSQETGWLPVEGHSPAGALNPTAHGRAGATLASARRGRGPQGKRSGQGDCQGRGPLPGPQWVGQSPPGSGCQARPSVTATINMFVQGKPGWEPCALAQRGRKGRLCLAHWNDCSCSRNRCPVAGKVRRPSGRIGSTRCLGPLCSCPAVMSYNVGVRPASWLRPYHL
jgi:hypothetical protein